MRKPMAVGWLGLAMMLALSACAPSGGSGSPAAVKNDGSAVSANPGVNPSLTITALAERAMSLIPPVG